MPLNTKLFSIVSDFRLFLNLKQHKPRNVDSFFIVCECLSCVPQKNTIELKQLFCVYLNVNTIAFLTLLLLNEVNLRLNNLSNDTKIVISVQN